MLKGSETDEKESSSETFAAAQTWNCLNVADFKRNPRLADEALTENNQTLKHRSLWTHLASNCCP